MTQAELKDTLRTMVKEYGFEQVNKSLREVSTSTYSVQKPKANAGGSNRGSVRKAGKRNQKVTASEYVAKMELPRGKEKFVIELAQRFESKAFLPTFGDISNFCQIYGIEEPASKSRANAIPRVFKFIAAMESDDIQRMMDDGLFSGPSRLGPIAEAIRRNGRATTQSRL